MLSEGVWWAILVLVPCCLGRATLNNNGYEDVLVAISPEVSGAQLFKWGRQTHLCVAKLVYTSPGGRGPCPSGEDQVAADRRQR